MRKLASVFILLIILLIFQTNINYACSGYIRDYPLPIEDFLPHTTIVRGAVIENSAGNSMLKVEYYLSGSGTEYLLIHERSLLRKRSEYVYECVIEHKLNPEVGTHGYFLLYKNADGSYGFGQTPSDQFIEIRNENFEQTVTYVKKTGEPDEGEYITPYDYVSLSLSEFEKMIAKAVGQQPSEPEAYSGYPRFRPLYIRAQSGQTYILPIDSNQLRIARPYNDGCSDECYLLSPDRNSVVYDISPNTDEFALWFMIGTPIPSWDELTYQTTPEDATPPTILADDVMFSPDSRYILAWYQSKLTIYAIDRYPISEGIGYTPALLPMWEMALETSITQTYEDIVGHGNWSADSQSITYWDAEGLKWIDLRKMVIPDLIAENTADDIPPLLEFVGGGQYIRYGTQSEWVLVDLANDIVLDDTLVISDGTQFFSISPETHPSNTLKEHILEQSGCLDIFTTTDDGSCFLTTVGLSEGCKPPFMGCSHNIPLTEGFEVQQIYWLPDNLLSVFMCDVEDTSLCLTTHGRAYGAPPVEDAVQTNAYEIDIIYHQIAWVFDDYILTFGNDPSNSYNNIDLSDQLDSPVVSLEWGEPLWYVEP